MKERAVSISSEVKAQTNGNSRVLTTVRQIQERLESLEKSQFCPLFNPLDIPAATIDYIRGKVEQWHLAFFVQFDKEQLPKGKGEAVILETGLLETPQSFLPLDYWLKTINYQPVCTSHPFGVNLETVEVRSRSLLKTSREWKDKTGKKVKWVLWSKGTVVGMAAINKKREEVEDLVDHIAFLGIPLECGLNSVVERSYLATQFFNKLIFGKNDFDYVKTLAPEDEIEIPNGVEFTIIDSKNNGVSVFCGGNFPGMFLVNGSHSGLPSNCQGLIILAHRFAGLPIESY